MKFSTERMHAAIGLALVVLAPACQASHAHRHLHQHHHEMRHTHLSVRDADETSPALEQRSQCAFPGDEDPNLVAVTPNEQNAGWAMSPDQPCKTDSYCPYACKPGMVMAQWKEGTSYPSMDGGLYCDKSGKVSKPFPNKPYCVEGTGAVKAVNKMGKELSFCQTVLPGNEAMLIPTLVSSMATLAVPDTSYWCETAAHFYVNGPGSSDADCVWGDPSKPVGNWSPYVAGANTDGDGNTFVKVGWNPIFEKSALDKKEVDFAIKIDCPDGGCTGTPCSIDPSKGKGLVDSLLAASGAGGSDFCVVTVSKGSTAHITVHEPGNDSDDDGGLLGIESEDKKKDTSSPAPTTTEAPSTSAEPTSTTEAEPTTTSESSTSTSTTTTSSSPSPTSTKASSTSHKKSSTKSKSRPTVRPGIFHENSNSTSSDSGSKTTVSSPESTSKTSESPATTDDKKDVAGRQSSPTIAGLVVAIVAAACFF